MRSFQQIALTACLVVSLGSSLAAQDRIPWITDLQVARQMAEQQQRLVLLHFYTDSCGPCQKLERSVFNRPELIRAMMSGYIPVKIDAQNLPQLANFYKVNAWPTDVVVDPTGKEVFRSASPSDANQYIAMLDSVRAHHSVGADPGNALSAYSVTPARTPSAGDPRLSMNYGARSSQFQAGTPQAGITQTPAIPQRTSVPMDNPYGNPLNRELPQQPSNAIAPRYANPYASNAAPMAPQQQSSPWQAPRQTAEPTTTPPHIQLPTGGATPNSSFQGGGTSSPSAGSSWNVPPANPSGTSQPGAPAWQQGTAQANPAWQNNNRSWNQPPAGSVPPANNRLASRAAPQMQTPPATQQTFALDGYCPVTLASKTQWTKGDPRWGAVHRGRTYLFASPADQQQFLANPDILSPILSGFDLVRYAETGQLVEGKRQHGVFYRDRICLFADEAALHQFSSQPERYVGAAMQAMQQSNDPRLSQ